MILPETFYKRVDAESVEWSPGLTLDDGKTFHIERFRANGHQDAFVTLYWDYEGEDQKIIASTNGNIDLEFDHRMQNPDVRFVGDGSKKLQIIIENTGSTQSLVIGGAVEILEVTGD